MRVLLVGALRVETASLLLRLRRRRRLAPGLFVGRMQHRQVAVATCGVGPRNAFRATSFAVRQFKPDWVVSVGTAGALVDDCAPGQLRCVDMLHRGGVPVTQLAAVPEFIAASCATVVRPVFHPLRRSLLAAAGAQIVEMESLGVYDAVQAIHPSAVVSALKVISDSAGAEISSVTRHLPRVVQIARFHLSAARLCRDKLAPAVEAAVAHVPINPNHGEVR